MGNVAKDRPPADAELPDAAAPLTVARMLALPAFAGARVVAGRGGLGRVVRRANVMEVPDIVAWLRPGGLLLTTGYPLRDATDGLPRLVTEAAARGVSVLAVKLHRYLERLPGEMLEEADRADLPLVVVPDGTGFDEVLTQVFTSLVSERAALLERGEDLHRELVNDVLAGAGIGELAVHLGEMLQGRALVTTVDGRPMNELGADTAAGSILASAAFHPSGRFRTELAATGVHVVEDLPGSHAVVLVHGGRIDHGRLVLFADRLLTDADVAVLERAAEVVAIAVTRDVAVNAVESKYRGDFLRDVLAGRGGTPTQVVAHARSLGWELEGAVAVVVAALDTDHATPVSPGYAGPLAVERFAAAWQTVVGRREPRAPVVGFASEVVALLPVPGGDARKAVEPVVEAVTGDGGGGRRPFATGVSRVVGSVEQLPAAYEQARRALHVGRENHGARALSFFDELGIFRLLSLIEDRREVEGFVAETLGELAGREDPEIRDLRDTLQVLLDTNLNVAETARRLHFHYNTLRYRIAKLERLVGPFTQDAHLRLELSLALRVLAMRERGPA